MADSRARRIHARPTLPPRLRRLLSSAGTALRRRGQRPSAAPAAPAAEADARPASYAATVAKRLAGSKHRSALLLVLMYVLSRIAPGRQLPAGASPARAHDARPASATVPVAGPTTEPQELRDLPASDWKATFKRTVTEFRQDDLTDWAAALTYYAVLSLFPSVIVLIAILGLAGQYPETSDALLRIVGEVGPPSAVDTFRGPIEDVVKAKGGAGALLGFGLLGAIWSASGYTGAFFRAANVIYETREGRPFWKLRPLQVLVTVVMTLLLALVAIAIVVTGTLAQAVGDAIARRVRSSPADSFGRHSVLPPLRCRAPGRPSEEAGCALRRRSVGRDSRPRARGHLPCWLPMRSRMRDTAGRLALVAAEAGAARTRRLRA